MRDAFSGEAIQPGMATWQGIVVAVAALFGMEAFAYAMHRWGMHGPLWFLHESHHRPRTGLFEKNDWFALVFAAPSIALIYLGATDRSHPALLWIGWGMAAYGLVYFAFHDVLVHRRIRHRFVPRTGYLRRVVQAHRIHHAVDTRDGCVSFGFLYAPPVRVLKAELRRKNGAMVRAPAAATAREAAATTGFPGTGDVRGGIHRSGST